MRIRLPAFVPSRLFRYGLARGYPAERFIPRPQPLKASYDVVILGGGGHGLATAYYLAARHGIRNLCVLEKGYLGGGNTARNTTIIRANYLTPEGVRFYKRSLELYRNLSRELEFNLLYSERGHLTLAHSEAALRTARWRAEVNKQLGVDSEIVSLEEIRRLCPLLDLSEEAHHPILGALYHPPGAIARHDAVAWGYARAASRLGVEIHQETPATALEVRGNRVVSITTPRGRISAGRVLQAVAGTSSLVAGFVGLRLPIHTVPLQACVSLPMKPFLDPIVVSGSLHAYVSQSSRGELVMGGATDPYGLYSTRSTLDFKERLMTQLLMLFPSLREIRVLRQWAGLADMTPDFSPIMGKTPLDNYYLDAGWGTWGFKATPVCGETLAHTLAEDRPHPLIEPFALERFRQARLVGEKGAAAVGH